MDAIGLPVPLSGPFVQERMTAMQIPPDDCSGGRSVRAL